jgi:DNA-binding response OmpR family regulator
MDPTSPSQRTILVVDDDRLVCEAVRELLGEFGFEALIAADGRHAVELYRRHADRITAVLLDGGIAGLTSEATCRAIRQIADVPIILASGIDRDQAEQRFGALKLAGYLQKPWRVGDLLALLKLQ